MYRAVYKDSRKFNPHRFKEEEVMGYFKSVAEFKRAVLSRWKYRYRDVPVFYRENNKVIVKFENEYGHMSSNDIIELIKIKETGWLQ